MRIGDCASSPRTRRHVSSRQMGAAHCVANRDGPCRPLMQSASRSGQGQVRSIVAERSGRTHRENELTEAAGVESHEPASIDGWERRGRPRHCNRAYGTGTPVRMNTGSYPGPPNPTEDDGTPRLKPARVAALPPRRTEPRIGPLRSAAVRARRSSPGEEGRRRSAMPRSGVRGLAGGLPSTALRSRTYRQGLTADRG